MGRNIVNPEMAQHLVPTDLDDTRYSAIQKKSIFYGNNLRIVSSIS